MTEHHKRPRGRPRIHPVEDGKTAVQAHRDAMKAAGMKAVTIYLPPADIAALDAAVEAAGETSRASLIARLVKATSAAT